MLRLVAALVLAVGCGDSSRPCEVSEAQPSIASVDCQQEFDLHASRPLDSSLPGAFTIKTVIDRADGDAVHFLDTVSYPLHSQFAIDHLGWPPSQPFIGEYLFPQRRFLLGSVTYFAEPDVWTYEMAPYDTADVDMIEDAFRRIRDRAFFGGELRFHPVSDEQAIRAAELPDSIPVITTAELYEGISYQPLNLGETIGEVRVLDAVDLATEFVGPRNLVVLDQVPDDISVVAGVVTEAFQTPLSHVNVLSQQRGTPNMGLRDARAIFEALDGKFARVVVGPFDYTIEEVSAAEAEAWFEQARPDPIAVNPADLTVQALVDVDDLGLADIPAVGGKAAHYGELRDIDGLPVRDGFAIPAFFYDQFITTNGLDAEIADMLADPEFLADGNVRRQRLAALRDQFAAATVDPQLIADLEARIAADVGAGVRVRLRSSTNAEDLEGFSGAGLYTSAGVDPGESIAEGIKTVWASLWNERAFEERDWVQIDHSLVAMAVLVHAAFADESANGVAITANIFDPAPGGEDAFYINTQLGNISVVRPPDPSIRADELIYFYFHNNQPATYLGTSSLVNTGSHVLGRRPLFDLGAALEAIRGHFDAVYDPPPGYATLPMDVEFKQLGRNDDAEIFIKQARPFPGRGQ
jgi:hypothetical protein